MANLTDGPWSWEFRTDEKGKVIALLLVTTARPVPANDPVILAVREDWLRAFDVGRSHSTVGRLVKAAPELLSALRDMVAFYRREMGGFVPAEMIERAARLIARVEKG